MNHFGNYAKILFFLFLVLSQTQAQAKCSNKDAKKWKLAKKGATFLSRTMVRDFILGKKYLLWCDKGVRKGESDYSNMRNARLYKGEIIITLVKKDEFRKRDNIVLLSCSQDRCVKSREKEIFVFNLNKKIREKNNLFHEKTLVLSDVDDTIICSLKDIVCDKKKESEYWIPSHGLYPGSLTLQKELAKGTAKEPSLGLILLSARFIEPWISQAYNSGPIVEGVKKINWRVDGIMHGHAADQINPQKNRALGDRKFNNLKKLVLIGNGENTEPPLHKGRVTSDKKTNYIFFGDNGEGDALAGKLMLNPIYPTERKMKAVFIHCLKNCEQKKDSDRFFYFDNYAEATQKALNQALISKESAIKVLNSIEKNEDFKKCKTDSRFKNKRACLKLKKSVIELSSFLDDISNVREHKSKKR